MTRPMLVMLYSLYLAAGSTLLVPTSADAQSIAAPSYGSADMSGSNGPVADARPGQYYFDLGVQASRKKDYGHAISMYEVAASWAYKPAEYNLAVMYVRGEGVPANLPRAMAWMSLAAERNETIYVKARDLIQTHLTPDQRKQAEAMRAQLLPTYGDAVALNRAKSRWREVRASATGSRVGSAASPVEVGGTMPDSYMPSPYYDVHDNKHVSTTGSEIAGARQTDGAVAYQQLRTTNNPYDPKFEQHAVSGTVSVGAMQALKGKPADSSHTDERPAATSSSPHP